jgi:type 1 fimbria pilin
MNTTQLRCASFACLALILSSPALAAAPSEVDVNFTFKLTGTTCSFDSSTLTQAVTLPDVGTNMAANAMSAWTPVNLKVTNCEAGVAKLAFEFDGTAASDGASFKVGSQNALGMELWSGANGTGVQAKPNVAMAPIVKVANGASYPFSARLKHIGAGALTAQANEKTVLTLKISYL